MAASARASRAFLFMQHCRRSNTSLQPRNLTSIRHSSSVNASPYAPSNFSRPASKSNASSSPFESSSPFNKPTTTSNGTAASATSSLRPFYAHPPASTANDAVTEIRGTKLTAWTWLKSLFGFRPTPTTYKPAPFHVNNNPYRARKQWPPDFRNLDPKQQFHFEKTYRRRSMLKWARPAWNKSIKILQHTLITFTLIYFVFICEPSHGQGTPFDGFRVWFFDKLGKLGQLPESTRAEADKLSEDARRRMRGSTDSSSPTASTTS